MRAIKVVVSAMVAGLIGNYAALGQVLFHEANVLLSGEMPAGTVSAYVGTTQIQIQLNLVGSEFVSEFYYENFQVPHPVATLANETGTFDAPTWSWNYHHAPNGLDFPFGLEFATANSGGGIHRFDRSDAVGYNLGYPMTTVWPPQGDIALLTDPGPYQWVAHVQGIGPDGNGSGWVGYDPTIPVPEPATYAGLFAIGLAAFAAFRRFRR